MTPVVFAVEKLVPAFDEIEALIVEHYREIALFKDKVPLVPKWDTYRQIEEAGKIHFCTARDKESGGLIGYYISIVDTHLHYGETLHAMLDIYFIKPEYRRGTTGIRLFQFMEEEMKKLGVQVIYTGVKLSNDISAVWERLGYQPVETKHAKYIGA